MFKHFKEKWNPTEPHTPAFQVENAPAFRSTGENLLLKENLAGGQHGGGPAIPPRPISSTIPPHMAMQVAEQELQRCAMIAGKRPGDADEIVQQISLMKGIRVHVRDLPNKGPKEAQMINKIDKMIEVLSGKLTGLSRAAALPKAKIGKFWQEKPVDKPDKKQPPKDKKKGGEKSGPAQQDKKQDKVKEIQKTKQKEDKGKQFER